MASRRALALAVLLAFPLMPPGGATSTVCATWTFDLSADRAVTVESPRVVRVAHLDLDPSATALGRFTATLTDGAGREVAVHRALFVTGTDLDAWRRETPTGEPGTWILRGHGAGVGPVLVRVCFA
ncbi:MAG TPA: hypothetical protein VM889_12445 [Candidatus Thermoplasmatota archaeon]|nr:hypothetical protein [Candidatus Thermoplasmatota archaeon]